jgi:hypothetical protein
MPVNIDSEAHYALTYRFLQVIGVELRAALHINGVQDSDQQRKILERFLFDLATSWDNGCIKDADSRPGYWYPTPCFRDDVEAGRAKTLVVPDGADAFHEMAALSVVEDLFAMDDPEKDWKFEYDEVAGAELFALRIADSRAI